MPRMIMSLMLTVGMLMAQQSRQEVTLILDKYNYQQAEPVYVEVQYAWPEPEGVEFKEVLGTRVQLEIAGSEEKSAHEICDVNEIRKVLIPGESTYLVVDLLKLHNGQWEYLVKGRREPFSLGAYNVRALVQPEERKTPIVTKWYSFNVVEPKTEEADAYAALLEMWHEYEEAGGSQVRRGMLLSQYLIDYPESVYAFSVLERLKDHGGRLVPFNVFEMDKRPDIVGIIMEANTVGTDLVIQSVPGYYDAERPPEITHYRSPRWTRMKLEQLVSDYPGTLVSEYARRWLMNYGE